MNHVTNLTAQHVLNKLSTLNTLNTLNTFDTFLKLAESYKLDHRIDPRAENLKKLNYSAASSATTEQSQQQLRVKYHHDKELEEFAKFVQFVNQLPDNLKFKPWPQELMSRSNIGGFSLLTTFTVTINPTLARSIGFRKRDFNKRQDSNKQQQQQLKKHEYKKHDCDEIFSLRFGHEGGLKLMMPMPSQDLLCARFIRNPVMTIQRILTSTRLSYPDKGSSVIGWTCLEITSITSNPTSREIFAKIVEMFNLPNADPKKAYAIEVEVAELLPEYTLCMTSPAFTCGLNELKFDKEHEPYRVVHAWIVPSGVFKRKYESNN